MKPEVAQDTAHSALVTDHYYVARGDGQGWELCDVCGLSQATHVDGPLKQPTLPPGDTWVADDETRGSRVMHTAGVSAVDGERQKEHGDPVPNMERNAIIWSAILGVEVTAHDVALCMVSFKLVRSKANPNHPDNYDDAEGYLEIARRCVERKS